MTPIDICVSTTAITSSAGPAATWIDQASSIGGLFAFCGYTTDMPSAITIDPLPMVNPWESKVLRYGATEDAKQAADTSNLVRCWQPLQDPLIYPGLYSGTGFDLMNILFYVFRRPNPQISLGPVDCSVAIVVCDIDKPDSPIVYASESFTLLTGYSAQEAVGKNCRFLQTRPDATTVAPTVRDKNRRAALQMRQAVKGKDEIQIELINYKKNGQQFRNMLSIIPVHDTVASTHLAIGFLAEY